jgi:hypothetical protein
VTAAGAVLTLAERWNGKRWQVRRTPTPGDQFSGLASVSCPAAVSCIAVGGRLSRSDDQVALAERWNGRAWRVLPAPRPGSQVTVLTAVSCRRQDSCMAVGYFDSSGLPQAFAARWNGRSWRVRKIPQEGILTSLACSGAGSCMAVGSFTSAAGHQQPLAVRWNGSGWRVLTVPVPAGSQDAELAGVSCASSASCVAVGAGDRVPSGSVYPAAVVWNGRSWRLVPVRAGVRGELIGVSCQAGQHRCVAVGERRDATLGITGTLAESWDGTTWRRLTMPQSPARQTPQLAAVSCRAKSACVAAGEYLTRSGRALPLTESWDGHSWRLLRTAAPDRSFDVLYDVSCARAMRCVAVGEQDVQRTLAERWAGARWHVLLTPNP